MTHEEKIDSTPDYLRAPEYPYMVRSTSPVEVGSPRNGRPGYRWVQGWIVVFSDTRTSQPERYRDAQDTLRWAKEQAQFDAQQNAKGAQE